MLTGSTIPHSRADYQQGFTPLRFRQWGSDYGAWQRVADETAGLDCVGLVASAEA